MSLQDRLERERLKQTQPPSHAHAIQLLRKRGISVFRVIAVHPDSILYLKGENEEPMTAWLNVAAGRLEISYEPGFPADPTSVLHVASGDLTQYPPHPDK